MSDSDLREAIDHLREALDGAQLDPTRATRIRQALDELTAVAADADATPAAHAAPHETLAEQLEHVAEEHPALATGLGRLVDILAKIGI